MIDRTYSELNKNCFYENAETEQNDIKRPFKVQLMWGIHFIVLDNAIHPHENEWYEQVRQPNGDVLLRRRA